MRPYTSPFDVSVLCSLYEAAPLAALEMIAMSLPIVVSNAGCAAEMVLRRRPVSTTSNRSI
ncbi:glycosyltransferase [Bradyrhizobium algeriense]|uniref:glycosyltransferase n=1 Tax=Bradyrhizobium algeriense TaxID=634784 RepID=UPI003A895965